MLIDRTPVSKLIELELLTEETNQKSNLPIHLAVNCKQEKLGIVVQILEKVKLAEENLLPNLMYYKLNEYKQSILQIAINRCHLNIIESILTDYYEDFDRLDGNGNLPIHLNAFTGSVKVLELLIKYKAVRCALNSKGESPLHVAARKNRFAFIKEFLKYERTCEGFEGEPIRCKWYYFIHLSF